MNYLANVLTSGLQSPKPTEVSDADDAFPLPPEQSTTLTGDVAENHGCVADSPVESEEQGYPAFKPRIPKTKTVLNFAHPPPTSKHQQRLHIRPKILLQIQQTSDASRPRLVYDVVPSASYASHLAQCIPHHFSGKAGGHYANDLTIVSSHAHGKSHLHAEAKDGNQEDTDTDQRRVIATIHRSKKGDCSPSEDMDIRIGGGSAWKASRLPSGSYEFAHLDEEGHRTVARWVPKRNKTKRQRTGIHDDIGNEAPEPNCFTFSILDPNARRHAVIAKLNPDSIEISDQYSIPPPLTPSPSYKSDYASDNLTEQPGTTESAKRSILTVDDDLKTLITITSVWVAFSEDFSPNFTYSQPAVEPASHPIHLGHKHRGVSLSLSNNHRRSPTLLESATDGRPTKVRSSVQHIASSPTVPVTPSWSQTKTPPQRSLSLSSAFVQKAKDRRLSSINTHHLSPISSFDEKGVDVGSKHGPICVCPEAPSNERPLLHEETNPNQGEWERVIPRSMRSTDEESFVENNGKTSKHRRFGKVFGFHRLKSRVH
ncbi:MAG: hypothetical protein Q9217_001228 [Psora testacea]